DSYAGSWLSAQRAACEATHLHGEQSEATLDLRMQCLARRLRGFSALLDVLERADGKVVEKALSAAHALEEVGSCSDPARLAQGAGPAAPGARARAEEIRRNLERGRALLIAGQVHASLELVRPAVDAARALAYQPLEAEALYLLGTVWLGLGRT